MSPISDDPINLNLESPISLQDFDYASNDKKLAPAPGSAAVSSQPRRRFEVRIYRLFVTRYIWTIPLCCGFVFPFFCVSMYLIASSYDHIERMFPYISDTGALPPEAGFFTQLMNIAAILVVLAGYIRYVQVKYYLDSIAAATETLDTHHSSFRALNRLYRLNLYSLLPSYPTAIGLMLIGCFRTSELPALHLLGNALILGIVFTVMFQILLCRQLSERYVIESPPTTMTAMLFLGLAATVITFVLTYCSFFIAGLNNAFDFRWSLRWTPEKPGYWCHIGATLTEWVAVAFAIPFYFVCLARRMRRFTAWHQVFFN